LSAIQGGLTSINIGSLKEATSDVTSVAITQLDASRKAWEGFLEAQATVQTVTEGIRVVQREDSLLSLGQQITSVKSYIERMRSGVHPV
jgi:hypothetical protein